MCFKLFHSELIVTFPSKIQFCSRVHVERANKCVVVSYEKPAQLFVLELNQIKLYWVVRFHIKPNKNFLSQR